MMASRYNKIKTMDELDSSLDSVRRTIEIIEATYCPADIISEAGTAWAILKKFKRLFSKK